jgi:methionyl-tRNA formyltransferase
MRIIFMGTDKFAVSPLKAIINSHVELACVITQPDRPKGRGLKNIPSPVKEVALGNNLMIYQPEKVRDKDFVQEVLNKINPDIIVVTAFGQILPKSILDLPPLGCINIHPSLLPQYRGAAPIQRAIINGEKETGVTIMFMDKGEDTGDIILQEKMAIDIKESAEILSQKLSELGSQLILETLKLARSTMPRQPQDHARASHAPKLSKEEGLIDWEKSAVKIHNLVRGTIPWPGAYTTFANIQLKIWESLPMESSQTGITPGTITDIILDKGIVVSTGHGSLIINLVQPANKSKMSTRDFVNGYRLKIGDEFKNVQR